ncbi:hypothetical protein O3M35_003711 [Rhynocoris fuscipes]|uniref:MTOR-associated protein MEAK7 n=1 Tax=Rhynocoris fuscipes TaxID=488301 RepID=A0AAW1CG97_9HEMI
MGARNSKRDHDKEGETEKFGRDQQIRLLFNGCNDEKAEITKDKVKELWHGYLTQKLLAVILSVLYERKRLYVLFEEFINFYWDSCEISTEHEAELMLKLVNAIGNETVNEKWLLILISEFIQSFFKIFETENDCAFNDWVKFGSLHDEPLNLAEYFLNNMDDTDDKHITVDALNSLFTNNALFRILCHHVYKTLFNTISLEKKIAYFPDVVIRSNYKPILTLSELLFLQWHLGQKSTCKWRLLFSIDNDGESWSSFLKTILGQGPTVIVIQDSNGFKFGAYASQSWNTNPNFYGDENSFIYTLHPKMNVFESSGYNKNFQYINTGQATLPNGLAMGGVHNYWGLFLSSDFGNGLVSESCTTYKNYIKLSSEKEFTVDKLQVWGVGAPDPTPEELGERTSILDKDPSAAVMLELAGRKLHSTEIRQIKHEQ